MSGTGTTFDMRLRTAMDAARLSVPALVERCDGAFSVRTIFRWRAGQAVPGAEALPILTRALAVSTDWLLGATEAGGPALSQPEGES